MKPTGVHYLQWNWKRKIYYSLKNIGVCVYLQEFIES